MNFLTVFLAVVNYYLANGQLSSDREELKNWCLKGKYHKSKPGPEDELHQQCLPWKNYSCCSHDSSVQIHKDESRYRFTRNHCGKLSEECDRHFVQDLCFYECEPYLGPWMVKVNMTVRKERFVHVPLCASDCDKWFASCANDFTCVENWIKDFRRENGTNVCPRGKTCKTFKEIYKTAQDFCEKVWDFSWEYTPGDKPCMRLWFDGKFGNPNERIADIRIDELMAKLNSSPCLLSSAYIFILVFFLMVAN